MRQRRTETGRERETETDRQTETDTGTETDRKTEREKETETKNSNYRISEEALTKQKPVLHDLVNGYR